MYLTQKKRYFITLGLVVLALLALVLCAWLEASDSVIWTLGGVLTTLMPFVVRDRSDMKKALSSIPPPSKTKSGASPGQDTD